MSPHAPGGPMSMLVRDWMQSDPMTIGGDTLVSEAKRLLSENLHALAVVECDRLRGLVTRANLLRMGHFVLRTQDPDEFNFFVTRLKVKDIMVRNPATVQAADTMEHCLLLGRQLGVAQLPVLDGESLVGMISAREIFALAAHCLAACRPHEAATAAGRDAHPDESSGIVQLQSMRPLSGARKVIDERDPDTEMVLRVSSRNTAAVLRALETAGFPVAGGAMPRPPLMPS